MQKYVLGFIHDEAKDRILLIQKNRPAFMAGKLNGVGGHVEEGEDDAAAMVRECMEECDLFIPAEDWISIGALSDHSNYHVALFTAVAPLHTARALTDEKLWLVPWNELDAHAQSPGLAPDVYAILSHIRPTDVPQMTHPMC